MALAQPSELHEAETVDTVATSLPPDHHLGYMSQGAAAAS
jgi:hypothetical protein